MKKFNTFIKLISALAAAVGAVYIAITYGDRIIAWVRQLLGCDDATATFHFTTSTESEAAPAPQEEHTEDAPQESAEAEAPAVPAEDESTPVANEEDFEG